MRAHFGKDYPPDEGSHSNSKDPHLVEVLIPEPLGSRD